MRMKPPTRVHSLTYFPFTSAIESTSKKSPQRCANPTCRTNSLEEFKLSKVRVQGQVKLFCPGCKDSFEKYQFCPFCYTVYFDNNAETTVDNKDWVQCDNQEPHPCNRWVHIECEDEAVRASLNRVGATNITYHCPDCLRKDYPARKPAKKPKRPKFNGDSPPRLDSIRTEAEKWKIFRSKNLKRKEYHPMMGSTGGQEMNKDRGIMATENTFQEELDAIVDATTSTRRPMNSRLRGMRIFDPNNTNSTIDNILNNYGIKLQLNDNEVISDLSRLRQLANSFMDEGDPASEENGITEDSNNTRGRQSRAQKKEARKKNEMVRSARITSNVVYASLHDEGATSYFFAEPKKATRVLRSGKPFN
eukprot:TRINITY_DN823_c0_g1_i11.p1 TRINITY_DN823_c0_g1~~TRINITY_DN823_c0_g1_i11.p1  ORF type:complete len:362 (+),score=62.29 TRINITY_DN823_c0_g1_i11:531-1616(+)